MDIKIETASAKELDELYEIEKQCFEQEAFSKRQIAYLLLDYNTVGLTAKKGSEIIGFIIVQVDLEEDTQYGHIITINVKPSYRRKGIATKLLQEIESILKQKGIIESRLEVREDNNAALKLYQKFGYLKVSKLERYYGKTHGIYLKKTL